VIQGHLPIPLNAIGVEQAKRLARRLGEWRPRIDALISSDLLRAAQTAEPAAQACGLPITWNAAWRERGFGELEGKTIGQKAIWEAASGGLDAVGAEPSAMFYERVRGALQALPASFATARTVAVVTHGGPCRAILKMFSDRRLPLVAGEITPDVVEIANCSIMRLKYVEAAWSVECVNDVAHLSGMANDEARIGDQARMSE
jgi:probable phosphoglycerate mutase